MTADDGAVREHEAFADWDGAYVLGALGPDDRHAYEDHLAGCARCRAAVGELAPLPGLLARAQRPLADDAWPDDQRRAGAEPGGAGPGGADAAGGEPDLGGAGDLASALFGGREPAGPLGGRELAGPDGPRPDLVERVVRRERRHRLRRRLVVAGVAALLVVGVAVGVPLATRGPGGPAQTVALEQRASTSLSATVAMRSVAWGTRLSMDCTYAPSSPATGYPGAPGAQPGPAVYTLVVTDVDGAQSQVSTWTAVPGQDVRLDAATAVPIDRIASLDVRSGTGTTLLSADLVSG